MVIVSTSPAATGPDASFWLSHREIGAGHAFNAAATYDDYYAIHTAYVNTSDLFLTGVVYNDANAVVTSWGFTIGFQPPEVIYPAKNAKVRNLSPEIRIVPFDFPYVYYGFEISSSPNFDKVIDQGYIPHQDNVNTYAGPDNELGTADDIRYVRWGLTKVLKPNQTYYYRVRGYYFDEGDLANKAVPSKESAGGRSESTGSFTIPPQSGSDSLANVTQITRDTANTLQPTLSKRLDLAYISLNPDEGSEIRVAGVQVQRGVPVVDTARPGLTNAVKG
jgi:hypothetical protein